MSENNKIPFQIAALDPKQHNRTSFNSGSKLLDDYFRNQVSQDIRRRITACFVATAQKQRIAGFYTLAAASILLSDLPDKIRKKLPRYPSVPAVRMGRLAVEQSFQGHGLGGALLADALLRASNSEIAAFALIVDAKNDSAAAFYQHHGFIALPNQPLILFLPLASLKSAGLL